MDKKDSIDKIGHYGQKWTKLDSMNKIGHYGQNWTLWTKLNSTDKIEWTKLDTVDKIGQCGQSWTLWTKILTVHIHIRKSKVRSFLCKSTHIFITISHNTILALNHRNSTC